MMEPERPHLPTRKQAIEWFGRHANEFRTMRNRGGPFLHFYDDFHAEATKCARTLFVTIDAGLLYSIWKPKDRPRVHCETTPGPKGGKLYKLAPGNLSNSRTRNFDLNVGDSHLIEIPDHKLDAVQLGQSWSFAVGEIWRHYSERFSAGAGTLDKEMSNELFVNVTDDDSPEDHELYFRYSRSRAFVYADACDQLVEIITARSDPVQHNRNSIPGEIQHAMTQLQLADLLKCSSGTIAIWANEVKLHPRKRGECYSPQEIKAILMRGSSKKSKVGMQAQIILKG